jgi:hypothetical protein
MGRKLLNKLQLQEKGRKGIGFKVGVEGAAYL